VNTIGERVAECTPETGEKEEARRALKSVLLASTASASERKRRLKCWFLGVKDRSQAPQSSCPC
jgi:hypothetical protein